MDRRLACESHSGFDLHHFNALNAGACNAVKQHTPIIILIIIIIILIIVIIITIMMIINIENNNIMMMIKLMKIC